MTIDKINLDNFYSGGYFLIRADRPDWHPPDYELWTDKLISLSTCICPQHFQVYWGWEPKKAEKKQKALDFGIPEGKWDEFYKWCQHDSHGKIDHLAMFYSPQDAQEFIKQFIADTTDLFLIGVGLPKNRQAVFLDDWDRGKLESNYGIIKRIKDGIEIEAGGTPLGFEIVSMFHYAFSHSWFCSGVQKDMHDLYGIRPGQYGLLQKQSEAEQVRDWIGEDGYFGQRGEPEPYEAWLLISYPLTKD